MFASSRRNKYTSVKNTDESVDLEPTKKNIFTPACFKTSLFTTILISSYFIPSIGLTFYQRWLYQVCIRSKFGLFINRDFSEFSFSSYHCIDTHGCKIFVCNDYSHYTGQKTGSREDPFEVEGICCSSCSNWNI